MFTNWLILKLDKIQVMLSFAALVTKVHYWHLVGRSKPTLAATLDVCGSGYSWRISGWAIVLYNLGRASQPGLALSLRAANWGLVLFWLWMHSLYTLLSFLCKLDEAHLLTCMQFNLFWFESFLFCIISFFEILCGYIYIYINFGR